MSRHPLSDGWSLDWSWAGSGLEPESGDVAVLTPFAGGALIAAIDGLGHGPRAALAARAAAALLEGRAADPLGDLMRHCHENLRKTRGVVMSVASFSAQSKSLTWCGVGNVEAMLFRPTALGSHSREAVLLQGGVVGYQMPRVRIFTVPIAAGDLLVMATDGIKSGFARKIDAGAPPEQTAKGILASHSRGTDDALVSVTRFEQFAAAAGT